MGLMIIASGAGKDRQGPEGPSPFWWTFTQTRNQRVRDPSNSPEVFSEQRELSRHLATMKARAPIILVWVKRKKDAATNWTLHEISLNKNILDLSEADGVFAKRLWRGKIGRHRPRVITEPDPRVRTRILRSKAFKQRRGLG